MSHFTVLVCADDYLDLEKRLLPYYEYGCDAFLDERIKALGILEFQIEHRKRNFRKDAQAIIEQLDGTEDSFTQYNEWFAQKLYTNIFSTWEGGELHECNWGYWHNPQRKWDWFQVGGRWTGFLHLKDEFTTEHPDVVVGDPGLMIDRSISSARCDACPAGMVDWYDMKTKQLKQAEAGFRNFRDVIKKVCPISEYFAKDVEGQREVWNQIRGLEKALSEEEQRCITDAMFFTPRGNSLQEHLDVAEKAALTFTILDQDRNWCEKGNMGWWATVTNEQADYPEIFWKFIEALPDDQMVWMVDCHI